MSNFDEYCKMTETAAKYGGPEAYKDSIKWDYYEDGFEAGEEWGYCNGYDDGNDDGFKDGHKSGLIEGLGKGSAVTTLILATFVTPYFVYRYQKNKVTGTEFEVIQEVRDKNGFVMKPGETFTVKEVGSGKRWKKVYIYKNRDYSKVYEVSSFLLDKASSFKKYIFI